MKLFPTLLLLTFTLFANIPSNTYDPAGNLKSKTVEGSTTEYSYDADGKLIQKGSVTYTYDANGNLIDDGTYTYEYDDKNRLVRVTTPTQTIEYSYDAQDHRIAKTTSEGTTTYLIDPNTPYAQVIRESKANGTEIRYTYGLRLLGDGEHTFLTDALGSTRGLADRAGQLTDSYDYTPYGELLRHTGSSDNSFLFTGEQYDPEAGLYYLRARYYSPELARFLTRDTFEGTLTDPITQNPYAYANDNPLRYVDPSGHMSMVEVSFDMSVMSELNEIQLLRINIMRQMMEEAGCFVITETLDMAVKEGIYMWFGDGKLYVGKSNTNIEARIKDHIRKKFKGAEEKLKHVMRINVKLPPKLLEAMEQAVMEEIGMDQLHNKRLNYNLKKPKRRKAYRRFMRLLKGLCK